MFHHLGRMGMSDLRFDLVVEYEDGRTVDAVAQQRELAEWERQPFGCSSVDAADRAPMLFFRFIAWSALRRRGDRRSFEVWSDSVVEVMPKDEPEDAAPPPPADPTQPGQPSGA